MLLNFQGYRRLSAEESAKVMPLAQAAAAALNLDSLPTFAISDDNKPPNAAAWTKTITLNPAMLKRPEGELQAILAHELAHWKNADGMGKLVVWAAGLPLIGLYEIGTWLTGGPSQEGAPSQSRPGFLKFIGYITAFPAMLLINFVLVPVIAGASRASEERADADVKTAGMGHDLAGALRTLTIFEPGRGGWQRRLAQTHPPAALRIEALEAAPGFVRPQPIGHDEMQKIKQAIADYGSDIAIGLFLAFVIMYALGHLPYCLTDRLPGHGDWVLWRAPSCS